MNEDALGVLFPDGIVARYGFKEGDVLEIKQTVQGTAICLTEANLHHKLHGAQGAIKNYRVTLRDLTK